MEERFARFPASLAERVRRTRVGDVPLLLAHPDWRTPAPVVLWMHGRTVSKELDSGRYLRWIRAGIAACAIDLPFHGERADASRQASAHALEIIATVQPEIDAVTDALADRRFGGVFDLDRTGIGGMSLGGMAALRRLCEGHEFRCATVESTSGWLGGMYGKAGVDADLLRACDPLEHLARWEPIPLLALHSKADTVVPWRVQEKFLDRLRQRYHALGVEPGRVQARTWERTGASDEHSGFGTVAAEAKSLQVEFLARVLGPAAPDTAF